MYYLHTIFGVSEKLLRELYASLDVPVRSLFSADLFLEEYSP